MLDVRGQLDHGIAFRVEGHGFNQGPVSGRARPARRMACPGLGVHLVASGRDGLILAAVALLGADVSNAAVAVIDVVPIHKLSGAVTVLLQVIQSRAP